MPTPEEIAESYLNAPNQVCTVKSTTISPDGTSFTLDMECIVPLPTCGHPFPPPVQERENPPIHFFNDVKHKKNKYEKQLEAYQKCVAGHALSPKDIAALDQKGKNPCPLPEYLRNIR